jgi:hypothetical protein
MELEVSKRMDGVGRKGRGQREINGEGRWKRKGRKGRERTGMNYKTITKFYPFWYPHSAEKFA